MGTKNNPGKFDCYDAAGPDEELFTLLARDPLAPFLVSIWAHARLGDPEACNAIYDAMMARVAGRYIAEPDVDKASEAMDCSQAMFDWKTKQLADEIARVDAIHEAAVREGIEVTFVDERGPHPLGVLSKEQLAASAAHTLADSLDFETASGVPLPRRNEQSDPSQGIRTILFDDGGPHDLGALDVNRVADVIGQAVGEPVQRPKGLPWAVIKLSEDRIAVGRLDGKVLVELDTEAGQVCYHKTAESAQRQALHLNSIGTPGYSRSAAYHPNLGPGPGRETD